MSEFHSLINQQNATFRDLISISLNISAILNRVVIKISKTTSIILHLIIIENLKPCSHYTYTIIIKRSIIEIVLLILITPRFNICRNI